MKSLRNINSLLLFLALALVLSFLGQRAAWADPASLRGCFVTVTQDCNAQSVNPAICIHLGHSACEAQEYGAPLEVSRAATDWTSPQIDSVRAMLLGILLGVVEGELRLP